MKFKIENLKLKTFLVLLCALALNAPAQNAPVPQIYSGMDFYSMMPAGQALTNQITIQPWPPTTATLISGLNFVSGPPQLLPAPTNGTNIFYLYPNYYRLTWAGLNYGATFTVLPGTQNLTNIAAEVNSGAAVFWGTNNFQSYVVVDTNDTTPGALISKFITDTNFALTVQNVNGNEQLKLTLLTTNFSVTVTSTNFTGVLAQSNLPTVVAYVNSNNLWNVAQTFPSITATNLTAGNLTVATNITIGSATLTAGTQAIVFTNGNAAINVILYQVSPTVYTNGVYGYSVVSNGNWNYLNPIGQTMWTLAGTTPIGNPWTIGSAGFGAAPGSSPVTVVNGTLQWNGQNSMTNLNASGIFSGSFTGTVGGTIAGAMTGTFNGGSSAATNDLRARPLVTLAGTNDSASMTMVNASNQFAGTLTGNLNGNAMSASYASNAITSTNDSNGRLLTTTLDTNLFTALSAQNVLVSPFTNLPPQLLTNPFYFSPVLGPNYVQLAVNSLPAYNDRQDVGGGKVIVTGQNFYPNTLVFTNSLGTNSIMDFDIEAPMFSGGALICATTPAIVVAGRNRGVNFQQNNLIISSLTNTTSYLAQYGLSSSSSGANIGKLVLDNNWYGYWTFLTNNRDSYGLAGLTPPTTGGFITYRNLIVSVDNGNADENVIKNNSFLGIQSFYLSPDHCDFQDNFFSFCGVSPLVSAFTAWQTNSANGFGLGAAVILGNSAVNQEVWYINNTSFYGCYAGFWGQQVAGYPHHVAYNTYYELTTLSEIGTEPFLVQAYNGENLTIPAADIYNNGDTLTNFTPSQITYFSGAYNINVPMTVNNSLQATLFNGNGAGLTNLNDSAIDYRAGFTNINNLALGTTVQIVFSSPFPPAIGAQYSITGSFITTPATAAAISFSNLTTNGCLETITGLSTGSETNTFYAIPYQ